MRCLFQKSHLVPLCHCLQEEKGRLKSIILTCVSLTAQELNSTSSASNRSQDLMAANGGTSQQAFLSRWRRQAHTVGLCAVGEVRCLLLGEVDAVAGITTCVRQLLQGWGWLRFSRRTSGNTGGVVLPHQSEVCCWFSFLLLRGGHMYLQMKAAWDSLPQVLAGIY